MGVSEMSKGGVSVSVLVLSSLVQGSCQKSQSPIRGIDTTLPLTNLPTPIRPPLRRVAPYSGPKHRSSTPRGRSFLPTLWKPGIEKRRGKRRFFAILATQNPFGSLSRSKTRFKVNRSFFFFKWG
jgi:hypothetical protein